MGWRATILIQLVKFQPGRLDIFWPHAFLHKVPARTQCRRSLVIYSTYRYECASAFYSPQCVGQPVRAKCSQDDEFLEGTFILPVLGESLLFRTPGFYDLPPTLWWALHVSVESTEVFHCRNGLNPNDICKTFPCSGKWHEVITCGLTGMKMWPSYMLDCTLMAPQACGERKDTGLTLLASTGKRSRKSNSWSSIMPCLSNIWGEEPRAVCNDLCRIDLFPVISTITENCKKPLASRLGKLTKAESVPLNVKLPHEGQPSEQHNF